MKIGIVIYSSDSETVWNAFRFGSFALGLEDEVNVFLMDKGVELEKLDTAQFEVSERYRDFIEGGGKVFTCGTCLDVRKQKAPKFSKVATLKELYEIVKQSDRLITF